MTPEGDVQNRIILTDKPYTPAELIEAANILNQNYAGLTFDDIRQRIHDELKQLREDMTRLMTAALDAGSQACQRIRRRIRDFGREQPARCRRTCRPT